jgi:hypothetical protein
MNNIVKVFYLVFIILSFSSCSQGKNVLELKRTVIAGVVNNLSNNQNMLVVNYFDPLEIVYSRSSHTQNLTESNGDFHVEYEYVFAQNLYITYAGKNICLFVHPGDSIFISIDANKIEQDFNNAVIFSGDHSSLNKEVFLWVNYWSAMLKQNPFQVDGTASPEDMLATLNRILIM